MIPALHLFDKGYAPANRYQIEFNLPRGIPDTPGAFKPSTEIRSWHNRLNGQGKINMLCHTCTMPQRNLLAYEHKQENVPYKVPYSQNYDNVSFVFYGDGEMAARKFFDIWQSTVINIKNNTLNFYDEYVADVVIKQLNKENKPIYGVKLFEAYPTAVTAIDYAYSNTNQVQNISIVMSYKYWLPLEELFEGTS